MILPCLDVYRKMIPRKFSLACQGMSVINRYLSDPIYWCFLRIFIGNITKHSYSIHRCASTITNYAMSVDENVDRQTGHLNSGINLSTRSRTPSATV